MTQHSVIRITAYRANNPQVIIWKETELHFFFFFHLFYSRLLNFIVLHQLSDLTVQKISQWAQQTSLCASAEMYQLINSPSYQCCVSVPAAQWPQMREDVAVINSGIDQGQLVGPLSLFLHHLWWFLRAASLEWLWWFTNGRRAGGVPNDMSLEHTATHTQTFFFLDF